MNQKIRQLENDIVALLNKSELPAEVLRLLLGKLEAQMTNQSNVVILREAEQNKDNVKYYTEQTVSETYNGGKEVQDAEST